MENITVENCREVSNEKSRAILESSPSSISAAQCAGSWETVYRFCRQNGMEIKHEGNYCGIEAVISFISQLIESKKEDKECVRCGDKLFPDDNTLCLDCATDGKHKRVLA